MVFLKAIGGSGYVTPSKASVRMLDEPLISGLCYLKQLCEASLLSNESSERPRSAKRDLIGEEPQRPHSALRGLLDAITEQPKPTAHQSSLCGILGVQK